MTTQNLNELNAISPIDGRYRSKVSELEKYFSEAALIHYRVKMEIEYLIFLSKHPQISVREISESEIKQLREIYHSSFENSQLVKDHETVINHDVKSVEYYIKDKLEATSLEDLKEWIHFATTSEDTNNIAYAMMISDATEHCFLPSIKELRDLIKGLACDYAELPIMARTHGQPASPTSFGKEFKLFEHRLSKEIDKIENLKLLAKINGATGNYNAHLVAFPEVDWLEFSENFIQHLNQQQSKPMQVNLVTSQIESHDSIAELFQIMQRINNVLIGFNQDLWRYISDNWLSQKANDKEVGSSTMPHKVNPIDFENSEGNLGIANALLNFFANKLQISRLQRDLSDSTVQRNIGLAFAYSILAYKSTIKGLAKITANNKATEAALDENIQVVAEAIQTILRREGYPIPYEQLKALTRGKKVNQEDIKDFINKLEVNDQLKNELKQITAHNYIGLAAKIARL